ncbi:Histone deacetylase HOS3 [Cyberlindnera fabianii]|uniref:Histone deacetylase HOS3 n=1 Tax=Cyberlindnera fabianii TaxID=36022 RepID=A0A1V2L734_CYBFA|nr:Histone deacetylase HOS3 [Cyberlindnera fabianii]
MSSHDTDDLSRVLSGLEIGDATAYSNKTNHTNNSSTTVGAESDDVDSLDGFKKAFLDFLGRHPNVAEGARFVANKDKTLIILSPLSTRHAFGRSWVSKTYLSTIVERPQRLLATSLGIAASFTMYPAEYVLMSSSKRSPLTSPHVLKIHGKNWPNDIEKICLASEEKLAKGEVEVPEGWNSGDIYLTKKSLDALTGVIGAVETAVDTIFKNDGETPSRAFVAIRPPGHHSHPCVPSGFCLINNAQIAIEYASKTQNVTHAVILDFDLHHGDGTQDICWSKAGFEPDFGEKAAGYEEGDIDPDEHPKKEANNPKVGYFSLHDINSFPTETGYAIPTSIKNASTCVMAHDLNIWNVHLQPYDKEQDFYKDYEEKYSVLLTKADEFLTRAKREHESLIAQNLKDHKRNPSSAPKISPFKAMVVISAGFDASEYEVQTMQRHGVHVPTSFYSRFTSDAVSLANKHTDGVLLSLLEGGYSDGALTSGVFSHLVGLQRQNWDHSWGKLDVVKELVKGCRPKWVSLKHPSTEVKHWANEVCKLGRLMLPSAIINPQPPQSATSSKNGLEVPNHYAPTVGSRVTRSHAAAKLPAEKMVKEDGDMSLDEPDILAAEITGVKSDGPVEASTPSPAPANEIKKEKEVLTGEFKHKFVKINGEWQVAK